MKDSSAKAFIQRRNPLRNSTYLPPAATQSLPIDRPCDNRQHDSVRPHHEPPLVHREQAAGALVDAEHGRADLGETVARGQGERYVEQRTRGVLHRGRGTGEEPRHHGGHHRQHRGAAELAHRKRHDRRERYERDPQHQENRQDRQHAARQVHTREQPDEQRVHRRADRSGKQGLVANDLVEKNTWQTFEFGPVLVENGEPTTLPTSFYVRCQDGYYEPRTAIGQLGPLHYIVIVVDGRRDGYSTGASIPQLQQLFLDEGAEFAFNLDGGGSTTLYFLGEVINMPSGGKERSVSDIIMFMPNPV